MRSPHNVLIIRSAQLFQFNKVFEELTKRTPLENIYVLSHADSAEDIKSCTGLSDSNILKYNYAGSFNVFRLRECFSKLKKDGCPDKFHSCTIVYNNSTGSGYFHVKSVPFFARAAWVELDYLDGTQRKFSKLGFAFACLRDTLAELCDQLAAFFLLLFGVLFAFPFLKLVSLSLFWQNNKNKKRIYFFTSQDDSYPSARVRCLGFAKQLANEGFVCKVFSLPSCLDLLETSKSHKRLLHPEAEDLYDSSKVLACIKLFLKLIFLPPADMYIQKPKYNFMPAFMIHLLRGDSLYLDVDDWEFSTQAFRYIKCSRISLLLSKRSKAVIAASHKLKDHMQDYDLPVYLVPTSPDRGIFFPKRGTSKSEEQCILGWAGIIFGHPVLENVLLVVKALGLVDRSLGVRLRISGRGALWVQLEDYVVNTLKEDRVEFCGWLEPEAMPDFLNSLDVGLMPLARKTPFLESKSPTKLFEYMAVGLPTISSPIGENIHIIDNEKNGFLASTKEEYAHYITLLASSPSTRLRVGNEAIRTIKEVYSLERSAESLHKIITP